MKLIGMLLIALSVTGVLAAQTAPVPEIDGQSLGSGLVLVSGLLMVARGRMKK
jgi:hypothetical protein